VVLTDSGFSLIKTFEGCRLTAYQDIAGVWTIGFGTTVYPNGQRVQPGDVCSMTQAETYFQHDLERFAQQVDALTVDTITPRQFDALVSLTYNIGSQAYRDSTVRKRVNAGSSPGLIREAWMRFHWAGGQRVKGLLIRRHKECDFFFGVHTTRPPMPT
jgi:lysozyme